MVFLKPPVNILLHPSMGRTAGVHAPDHIPPGLLEQLHSSLDFQWRDHVEDLFKNLSGGDILAMGPLGGMQVHVGPLKLRFAIGFSTNTVVVTVGDDPDHSVQGILVMGGVPDVRQVQFFEDPLVLWEQPAGIEEMTGLPKLIQYPHGSGQDRIADTLVPVEGYSGHHIVCQPLIFKIGNTIHIRADGFGNSGYLVKEIHSSGHSALGPDLVIVHSLPANRCQFAHTVQGADLLPVEFPGQIQPLFAHRVHGRGCGYGLLRGLLLFLAAHVGNLLLCVCTYHSANRVESRESFRNLTISEERWICGVKDSSLLRGI